jgi:hypothetical protein
MGKAGRTEKKRRRLWRIIRAIAALALAAAMLYCLIASGGKLDLDEIWRTLSELRSSASATEFVFTPGYDSSFADLNGALVTAGAIGFKVFGADGEQIAYESFKMSNPLTAAAGSHAAVYDAGGLSARLIDASGRVTPIETEYAIIAASINKNGWLTLCTREGGGYRGSVTVYGPDGGMKYKWYSAQGYVISAALSNDNRDLAVLSLREAGGAVTFLRLRSEEVRAVFELADEVVLEIKYRTDGRLLAVTGSRLILIDGDGTGGVVRDYSDRRLGGWAFGGDGLVALMLFDNSIGGSGTLVTYDAAGVEIGAIDTDSRSLSISVSGGTVAVLWRDRLSLYGASLKSEKEFWDASDAVSVVARSDGTALAIGRGMARVCAKSREPQALIGSD